MTRSQLTIADPQDQIKSKLHTLKRVRGINISHFCRDAVKDRIDQFNDDVFSKDMTKFVR